MARRPKRPPGAAPDPRGGARQGTPGQQYPNRSDMRGAQPVRTATGQTYGQGAAQARSQQAVPLPAAPGVPSGAQQPMAVVPPPGAYPEDVPNLTDPTQRPDEPITAGLPFGAGPGPTLDQGRPPNPTAEFLRGVYLAQPTPELRELLAQIDLEG